MFGIIYVLIAIVILNAMLMAVFERIREFGLLKALGVAPNRVLSLIFVESGLQTGLALILGVTFSLPGLWYLTTVGIDLGLGGMNVMGMSAASVWRGHITPATFLGPVAMLTSLVGIAVTYPALKAARIRPVEAMRHQ